MAQEACAPIQPFLDRRDRWARLLHAPNGRRKRIYDAPRTPFGLITAGILSPAQQDELTAYLDGFNPVELARRITELQGRLIDLSKGETDRSIKIRDG